MSVRPILLYPDPILKGRCSPVAPDDPQLPTIINHMLDSLGASPGVALAAPQIGYAMNIIVVDVSQKKDAQGHGLVILLNPRLLHQESPRVVREGCLSVPDFTGNVRRYEQVVVEGTTPDGSQRVITASGFEALAFQHEIDHLAGILFLDRIASLSTDLFRRNRQDSR